MGIVKVEGGERIDGGGGGGGSSIVIAQQGREFQEEGRQVAERWSGGAFFPLHLLLPLFFSPNSSHLN